MVKQFHLADLFEAVAATVPDRVALISDSLSLTYAELNDRANRLAAGLAAHGLVRGDTVGLYLMNRAEHVEAFIAIVKLGAVPFNINYRYRPDELRYLFDNAQSAAVIHGAEYGDIVRELRPELPGLKLAVAVEDGSGVSTEGSVTYAELLSFAPSGPWPRGEDDIILTYTGGTTGMPKGVMWPHKAFVFACAGGGGYFNPVGPLVEPADIHDRASKGYPLKLFPVAPLMHAAALWSVWSGMLNGLTIVVDEGRSFDPVALWDKIERLGVNIVQIVGDAMAIPLRDALLANPERWSLAHMFNFGSGGAVFSQHVKDDLRRFLPDSCGITDGMGSSETGVSGQADGAPGDGMMRLPANENQQVVIEDRLAKPGETGFIARSGHTPVGYFNDPVKSAEVFRTIDARLWSVSGDAGRLDDDGMITVFGRGSTCINSGGEKIFPEEVEEALRAHPAIQDAVVAGQPDPRWGERVVGVVSLRSGADRPDYEDVRAFLSERLAGYKLPKALVWVDDVKRSAAGKQDYRWAKSVVAEAA
ncbi:AMP-binding protein [Sphingomonas lacunae]|uniref:AMP-binding protein n=1 Tax=Sphingomonas lacunae TaxID=2698828 RepID=A0A6M4AQM1_9SPHN|nr:AMP-binding protein [Sphingomonas lacunae]QJQ31327.1 AMP-binding protein [Sphingomonas lacunae]